ncbi:subtilisin-like protease SBT5.4 [Neltuma alba]|uniref:subtilisin-like protease SBT5.4 n=1 Tax=Neltuma alba TaxID=207710 RepID=UPI0010A32B7B|nr:subtilisin-like protease SBT5.4 [Prosopis alba]
MSQTDVNGVARGGSCFKKARFGADVIIANIDGGSWPESQSFSDEGMGPIPSRWKGACDEQVEVLYYECRKLIGARFFNKGYMSDARGAASSSEGLKTELHTPRDYDGHGTHTLSTAAGCFVHGVNIFDRLANGTASGGSPMARVAAYKVCWPDMYDQSSLSCHDSDILAAFDMAIHDGVHVISVSLGSNFPQSYLNGINVVCSGGNAGPFPQSVINVAPWVFTVAASTIDKDFQARVQLRDGQIFQGASLSKALPQDRFYPLIAGAEARRSNSTIDDANLCLIGTIDPKKVKGKILVCLTSDDDDGYSVKMEKGYEALQAGAAAMILCSSSKKDATRIYMHLLPAAHIKYKDTLSLLAYLKSTKNPMATIHPPSDVFNSKPSPAIADFSSRGPSTFVPEILKPDITAPGVNILAAYSPAAALTGFYLDNRRNFSYNLLSGTSMSCPHVSGVVSLLKTFHPDWSPAAIKSAIMTTSKTRDSTGHPMLAASDAKGTMKKATPFEFGSGHIRPNQAIDPGLVYDLTLKDYLNLMCGLNYNATNLRLFYDAPYKCPYSYNIFNFSYPSITIPVLYSSVNVSRSLKNVGLPGTYVARVLSPPGLTINVEPKTLTFDKVGEERSFTLTIEVIRHGPETTFGRTIWSDGKHFVRSPITVGGVLV